MLGIIFILLLEKLTHIFRGSLSINIGFTFSQLFVIIRKGEIVETKILSFVELYIYTWILMITNEFKE